jgi:Fe-S oxidoreductase/nitrate reductase gamma subunit
MWNITGAWIMYALFGLTLVIFGYGLFRRIQQWRGGKPDGERFGDWGKRLVHLVKELVLQRRVRGSWFPGIFHSLIFYSFLVLVVVTAVVAMDYDFGTSFFRGWLYVTLTVAAEVAGLLVLVGIGMALWRRSRRPKTLPHHVVDTWVLVLIGGITLTGFLVEGLRIATAGDPWANLSFVGLGFSKIFTGISQDAGKATHLGLWWFHLALAFGFIAAIPYTKFFHILALPTNIFFSKLGPRGSIKRSDLSALESEEEFDEDAFKVGIEGASDFTWKQRLDFDACIQCGRCEEICPAVQAGHPFSPREFIQTGKALVARAAAATKPGGASGEAAEAAEAAKAAKASSQGEDGEPAAAADPVVVGEGGLDEQFIWYCRMCMACMEVCPACIDHADTIVEVRRNQVMMHEQMPMDASRALKMLESRGNPFGPQSEREDWPKRLGVRMINPGESCDVLYFVGCCTTYDPTKQRIAMDLVRLLDRCGIDFGILGGDERCCGDPARVLGDERLFQEVARGQIEELKSRNFKYLLTGCPHCYNVLKNEYPTLGGNFNVVHHSEFLHEMLWSGDLLPSVGLTRRVTYHDPCFLGRYQRIFDSPRETLRALPGADFVEMANSREQSFCCGGGGGHFWMDLKSSECKDAKRINNLRVQQAVEAGADTLVTSCAYCQQMLTDSTKAMDVDEKLEVIDIGSLVLSTLRQQSCSLESEDGPAPSEEVRKAGA